jgi:hemoglobin
MQERTVYEAVGGEPAFRRLARSFYAAVADDPVLRRVYPQEDLAAAEHRLGSFLMQYWGGPGDYSRERGHPRLRMRHAPFAIGTDEQDAWLRHMRSALDELALPPDLDAALWDHLHRAALMLRNR